MTVRVRFAPSPTGYLHIGGARTALFNWMFARKHGGDFILRIEDTDQSRYVENAVENLMESLRWLGIDWDEGPDVGGDFGPYTQSERLPLYQKWAQFLLDNGHAYKDYTTKEELAEMRAYQKANGLPLGYDRRHRDLSEADSAEFAHLSYTVRLKVPLTGQTTFNDLVRGDITFDNDQLNDLVLLKSDGFPTYHLANVVDDHFMEITHIMRAEEWISTAPLHKILYDAFGWEMPAIAHPSVILSPSGRGKLSKRDQNFEENGTNILIKTLDYRDEGYLPEAVVNWLANIGWNYGNDVELFDMAAAIPRFTIPAISPAPTKLPFSKLEWINSQYIQALDDVDLAKMLKPVIDAAGIEVNVDALVMLIPALKPRLKRFPDAVEFMRFLDDDAWALDATRLQHKKMDSAATRNAFAQTLQILQDSETLEVESLGETLRALGESVTENGKAGPYLGTLRYAVTGQKVSPPLFESIVALGKVRAIKRIEQAVEMISAEVTPPPTEATQSPNPMPQATTLGSKLADQLVALNNDMRSFVTQCNDAQWVAQLPDEGWPVNVAMHHILVGHYALVGFIKRKLRGQPVPDLTTEMIDNSNASNASSAEKITQAEVLALLEKYAVSSAEFVRTLTDEQLNQTFFFGPANRDLPIGKALKLSLVLSAREHLDRAIAATS